jgi:hypothetical protein
LDDLLKIQNTHLLREVLFDLCLLLLGDEVYIILERGLEYIFGIFCFSGGFSLGIIQR